jgi:formate-dependent nitrite reductase cytochrome c552 subunit
MASKRSGNSITDQTRRITENLNKKKFQTTADEAAEAQRQEMKKPSKIKPPEPLWKDPLAEMSGIS